MTNISMSHLSSLITDILGGRFFKELANEVNKSLISAGYTLWCNPDEFIDDAEYLLALFTTNPYQNDNPNNPNNPSSRTTRATQVRDRRNRSKASSMRRPGDITRITLNNPK